MEERIKLLEDIQKNIPIPIQTAENQIQTDDDEHEKILEINKSLKTMKDKFQCFITERPDLFNDNNEDINECFDRFISSIKTQASKLTELQK